MQTFLCRTVAHYITRTLTGNSAPGEIGVNRLKPG